MTVAVIVLAALVIGFGWWLALRGRDNLPKPPSGGTTKAPGGLVP